VIFKFRNKKKGLNLHLDEEIHNGCWYATFCLEKDNSIVPTSEWSVCSHDGALWLCNLITELKNDKKSYFIQGDKFYLEMSELIRQADDQEIYLSQLLQLPCLFDGGIEVKGSGLLHHSDFKISYNWISGSGRPLHAKRKGAILIVGEQKYLLPYHAYSLSTHLDELKEVIIKSKGLHEKLTELAEFKNVLSMLPLEECQKIKQSSDLNGLKLYYANAFRIEPIPEEGGYNFRPVLLRRHVDSQDSNPVFECILPPAEQVRYANQFFKSTTLLPQYNLGVGKYLIINEQLNKALKVVHKIQHASVKEKEEFLRNPKAVLAEQIEGVFDVDGMENIFSDRVIGVGEWQDKVIPWIKMPTQDWMPGGELPTGERGILIGEDKIFLSQDSAQKLSEELRRAIDQGQETVKFQENIIPANLDVLGAVKQIIPIKPTDYQSPNEKKGKGKTEISLKPIILVKENLGSLEYIVHRTPRSNVPQNSNFPEQLRSEPKQHQKEAYNWLLKHYCVGSRGVLLADDMGLGKTFQALMFLAWLREGMDRAEIPRRPLLIVAPTGLLKNWEAEIENHLLEDLGHLVRVYGAETKRLKNGSELDTSKLSNAGLVLTTYDTLTIYQTSFSAVTFSAVVFDEIQKLKNPGILNYSAACSLKSEFWIGMTGTPVENRLCDLWSISDVLQPGMLGTIKEFSQKYEKVILEDQALAETQIKNLQDIISHASENAPPFMMRRMKYEKLPGLPAKHIKVYKEPMPEKQFKIYNDIMNSAKRDKGKKKGVMLEALHKLRACSLHPDYKRTNQNWQNEDFINASARLKVCFKILEDIKSKNEKALIFIEYNEWHRHDFLPEILRRYFALKNLPMVINGQVDSISRQKRVDQFQSERGEFDVMLLSPKAGGVGLTLTAANHVIHLTRWWNPAVEDQASDRIYRIGQDRPVFIHYPLAVHPELKEDSFDVILNNILENKRKLRDKTLITLPDISEVSADLIKRSFGKSSVSDDILNESYMMSGREYENYVLQKLQNVAPLFGLYVRDTPQSWDGGADMVVETRDGEIIGVIQCKHVSSDDKTSELSSDLERAIKSYECKDEVWKIGVTNAQKLSGVDKAWEKSSTNHLIVHGENGLNPEKLIFQYLSSLV